MNRRGFLKGSVAVAVAAALPGAARVPSVLELNAGLHEPSVALFQPSLGTEIITEYADPGHKMARALARSMMQTREIVARNVLEKAFE